MAATPTSASKNKLNFSLDVRLIIVVLLAVIIGMFGVWKPWAAATTSDRTIKVTGEAKLTAEPDEYVFSPSWQFKDVSKDAALAALTKKSNDVTAELKKLGIEDKNIKSNSNGYDYPVYFNSSTDITYTLSLTVTVASKDLAQKVQDFLVTTSPVGAVSPQADFSTAKRKDLESKARDEATKDARSKADQTAKNLGFKIGKVKEITDGTGFGEIMPLSAGMAATALDTKPSLAIQPGQNDLNYSITVTYFVK